jgi:hypothetical protein
MITGQPPGHLHHHEWHSHALLTAFPRTIAPAPHGETYGEDGAPGYRCCDAGTGGDGIAEMSGVCRETGFVN